MIYTLFLALILLFHIIMPWYRCCVIPTKIQYLKARDHTVLTYTISLHSFPKWFNFNLRHLLNKIHSFHFLIKSKSTPSSNLVSKLSQMDSVYQAQVHLAKNKYIQTLNEQHHSTHSKLFNHYKVLFLYTFLNTWFYHCQKSTLYRSSF